MSYVSVTFAFVDPFAIVDQNHLYEMDVYLLILSFLFIFV